MSRSSGFKINKNLDRFLQIMNVNPQQAGISQAEVIFEIRAILGKYVPLPEIVSDLNEIGLMEQQQVANDNIAEGD